MDINDVIERLTMACSLTPGTWVEKDVGALLADHARLQRLGTALAGWSLAVSENGTVGVVCMRDDSPGGDIAIADKGRLEQRLLHALVTDIVAAQKEVQS